MLAALRQRRLLSWLIAVLLVTTGFATGVTTDAPTAARAASTAPSPPVFLEASATSEQRGDVAEFAVHFSSAETATVRIGSE